ncbi:MAG: MFS transporter [Anaerolineales bacterium]|nr:MFS transporter [Anaerolineales bacterium]
MLLHQSDKLLIGPLTTPIMETFGINEAQMGAVSTGALLVGAILYPLWGYLYDRFSRVKLLALASAIWGGTTMLNASAPSYSLFLVTRASTGIDDASYPGLYSMVADLFGPERRGKIYGLLQLTQPLGYLVGMMLGLILGGVIGWRNVFYITGAFGILLAVVIYFGVKEPPRGQSEPEMADLDEIGIYRFNLESAKQILRTRTMYFLFLQGFFGVFPWQVITFWIFRYLEVERGYTNEETLLTLVIAILFLAPSYYIGGALGDLAFKRTPRGRMIVSIIGVLLGAIFLAIAINVPVENRTLFMVTLVLAVTFMPWPAPNMVSSVNDITLPEVRSSALAIQLFIENAGAATAPLLAGLIAVRYDLGTAIVYISVIAWLLCACFYSIGAFLVPRDIATLREEMRERAEEEIAAHPSQAGA